MQVIEGVAFQYSPPPRSAVPYAAALKSGADQAAASEAAARKQLGFASPPSNKENFASLPAFPGLPHTGHQQGALRMLSVLGSLPSTPAAAVGAAPELLLPQLAALMPSLAQGMAVDSAEAEPEAVTPVYTHGAGKEKRKWGGEGVRCSAAPAVGHSGLAEMKCIAVLLCSSAVDLNDRPDPLPRLCIITTAPPPPAMLSSRRRHDAGT